MAISIWLIGCWKKLIKIHPKTQNIMETTGKQMGTSGYIAKTLRPSEELIYYTGLHWIVLTSWSVYWLVLGLFLWFAFEFFLAIPLFIFCVISLIISALTYKVSEFAITDLRVIIKVGFFKQIASEIYLSKIESIHVKQGLLGRLLDFGVVVVTGTGGSKNVYKNVRKPLEFKKVIQDMVDKN